MGPTENAQGTWDAKTCGTAPAERDEAAERRLGVDSIAEMKWRPVFPGETTIDEYGLRYSTREPLFLMRLFASAKLAIDEGHIIAPPVNACLSVAVERMLGELRRVTAKLERLDAAEAALGVALENTTHARRARDACVLKLHDEELAVGRLTGELEAERKAHAATKAAEAADWATVRDTLVSAHRELDRVRTERNDAHKALDAAKLELAAARAALAVASPIPKRGEAWIVQGRRCTVEGVAGKWVVVEFPPKSGRRGFVDLEALENFLDGTYNRAGAETQEPAPAKTSDRLSCVEDAAQALEAGDWVEGWKDRSPVVLKSVAPRAGCDGELMQAREFGVSRPEDLVFERRAILCCGAANRHAQLCALLAGMGPFRVVAKLEPEPAKQETTRVPQVGDVYGDVHGHEYTCTASGKSFVFDRADGSTWCFTALPPAFRNGEQLKFLRAKETV